VHLAQLTDQLAATVRGLPGVQHVQALPSTGSGGRLVISLHDPLTQNPAIVQALVSQGARVQFVNELRHSLEDIYLSLMQNDRGNQGGAR
jgi:hypothetical protein